jgi:hypothetical protein
MEWDENEMERRKRNEVSRVVSKVSGKSNVKGKIRNMGGTPQSAAQGTGEEH